MVKKFEKEKTYIFSKERFVEVSGIITESSGRKWYDRVDGVKVEVEGANIGKCWEMLVVPEWCEEVDTEPKANIQINKKEMELIIKSLDYLNNNNYFIEEAESELAEKLIKELNKKAKEKY